MGRPASVGPSTVVGAAVLLGLLGGLVEVAAQLLRRGWTPFLFVSRDFAFSAPLALAAVGLSSALAALLIGRLTPRLQPLPIAVLGVGTAAAWSPLMLAPGVHHAASLLLSLGIAVQLSRSARSRPQLWVSCSRVLLPIAVAVVLVVGTVVRTTAGHTTPAAAVAPPAGAPNLVMIVLDTVRAQNMGLYGYPRDTTPELQRWATEGVVFEQAISAAPWTLTAHAALFTGRYPHEVSADWTAPLDDRWPTLAQELGGRGYASAGFVANLGYCSYETGLDRGFAWWEDYTWSLGQVAADSQLLRTLADNFRLRTLIRNDEHLNRKTAAELNRSALDWVSGLDGRPFFLFLNYFDAHEPYFPPPPFDARFKARRQRRTSVLHHYNWDPAVSAMSAADVAEELAAYDGAIAYLDHTVSELLARLQERGLMDNTLVVLTSDHGEEFGEHGLFDHGNSLYLPALRVPLLIWYPPLVPAATRVQAPVSTADLPATLFGLLQPDAVNPFPGQSLAATWQPGAATVATPALSEVSQGINTPARFPVSRGDMRSLVGDTYHYILNGDGVEELYELGTDPDEVVDLATSPAAAQALRQLRQRLRER